MSCGSNGTSADAVRKVTLVVLSDLQPLHRAIMATALVSIAESVAWPLAVRIRREFSRCRRF